MGYLLTLLFYLMCHSVRTQFLTNSNTKNESVLARDHIVVPVRQDKIVCNNKRKQTVGEDGWWVIATGEGTCVLYAYDVLYQL